MARNVTGTATAKHTRRPDESRFAAFAVFALLWVPYAALVYRFWFICDDAYISFRYARNWAEGFGLRYNLGEHVPVEGYSNFLWVAVCALVQAARGEVTFWAPLLSFACGTILLYLVFHILRSRLALNGWTVALTVLFLGCSPAYAVWSTSGLETMPFALLLFITFERLVLRKEGPAWLSGGLAGLALSLMRVEGVYWAAFLIPLAVISRWSPTRRAWRSLAAYAAIVAVGYAVYFAFRYGYYKLPFSNSTYVKMGVSGATLQRGFDYLAVQCLTLLTPFLVVPGVIMALRGGRRRVGIAVSVMALAVLAFSVIVSGDFMAFGRLLVPGLTFCAILYAWLINDCRSSTRSRQIGFTVVGLAIVCIGFLPAMDVNLVPLTIRRPFHFRHNSGDVFRSELEQWRFEKDNADQWGEIGRLLHDHAEPGDSLVGGAIGAVGYYSNLFIYDGYGLVTRKVAARDVGGPVTKSPGHDKAVAPTFFLVDRPTYLDVSMIAVDTRERVAAEIMRRAAGFRRGGPHQLYVPEFKPLPVDDSADKVPYVFILRRIEEGADPEAVWAEFAKSLRAFAAESG